MINQVSTGGGMADPIARKPGGEMGKDEFLKLLVTQMQNQDPLSPMDGQQMAVQIAQFTQVEQLMGINSGMDAMLGANAQLAYGINTGLATSMIGRSVVAEGNSVTVGTSGRSEVTVDVGRTGGKAKLRVFDAAGTEVAAKDLGQVANGRQTLGWDSSGLPAGSYTYKVEVADAEGNAVPVTSFTRARIDAVEFTAEGILLISGKQRINMNSVVEVLQ